MVRQQSVKLPKVGSNPTRPSKGIHICVSWSRLKPEIDKCDLLCQNCHAEEHYRLNDPTREEQRRILDTYKKRTFQGARIGETATLLT